MGFTRNASLGIGLGVAGSLALAAGAQEAPRLAAESGVFEPGPFERIGRAEDLSRELPGLEVHPAFRSDPNLYVRGIGQQHDYENFTGPVAIYTDGVYANRSAGQLFEAFDLERAELLRGPQGGVYGRNATAGALLLRSRRPDGELSGDLSLGYGNYHALALDGAVGFPVVGETLAARVAGTARFRDGITRNACRNAPSEVSITANPVCDVNGFSYTNNQRLNLFPVAELGDFQGLERWTNDVHDWAGRGLLRFRPSPAQDWLLKLHGERNRGDSRHLQMRGTGGSGGTGVAGRNELGFSEDSEPRYDTDPFVGWYEQEGDDQLDRWGASLTGEIDLGGARLTSLLAFWRRQHLVQDEGDATPDVLLATDWEDETRQWSYRLRADGGEGSRSWSAGAELLHESYEADNLFKSNRLEMIAQSLDETLWSVAPYFHARWQLDPRWSAEIGGRVTWERREVELETATRQWERIEVAPGIFASGWDDCCTPSQRLLARLPELREDGSWLAPTGEFALHYAPADDVRLYAKYTRGRKSAQFYGDSFTDDQSLSTARPEFVHAGELGLRSQWLDGALGFDAAVFYADYRGMQVFDMANEVARPAVRQLLNGDARALGVDAAFAFRPLPGLRARIDFGWLDAVYTDFSDLKQITPPFPRGAARAIHALFDYTGNPLVGAPRYRLWGRVDYALDLGRLGALLPDFAFRYRSKTYWSPAQDERLAQPAYWVLDAGLAWRAPGGHLELAGWVRNFTDEHYRTDAFSQTIALKQILYVYADPRLFGGSLHYRW
ncbi:MAG TPA: TonB-dependent receptor [Myxococcota bacterium]